MNGESAGIFPTYHCAPAGIVEQQAHQLGFLIGIQHTVSQRLSQPLE